MGALAKIIAVAGTTLLLGSAFYASTKGFGLQNLSEKKTYQAGYGHTHRSLIGGGHRFGK